MPGGRPPTPTKKLKLHGGLRPERHSDREREPQPEGDAIQFVELTGEALKAWEFLQPRLIAVGLAAEVDSVELIGLCEWWGEYRKWVTMKKVDAYKRTMAMATAYKQFRAAASKFGLNPTDRVGLEGTQPTQEDATMALIKRAE